MPRSAPSQTLCGNLALRWLFAAWILCMTFTIGIRKYETGLSERHLGLINESCRVSLTGVSLEIYLKALLG